MTAFAGRGVQNRIAKRLRLSTVPRGSAIPSLDPDKPMRTLLAITPIAALGALLLVGPGMCPAASGRKANQPDEKEDGGKPKLRVGDPAPPLKVSRWLHGEPIKEFVPGKVYVLDFWATWCRPCIATMPHLNELVAEFKDQGLVAAAVTTADSENPAEAVEEFVKVRGSKYGFAYALCEDQTTEKAYMLAAGQAGIPCSFVIDKAGKVAFIGHPMELDDVLPRVLAGTWRGQADIAEMEAANKQLNEILELSSKEPDAAVAKLPEYEKAYPWKAALDGYAIRRMVVLLAAKKGDEAKAAAEPLAKKFAERKDAGGLETIRDFWTNRQLNPGRYHLDVGLAAADALVKQEGDKSLAALAGAAEAYFDAGKPEKALEYAQRAAAAAESEKQKAAVEKLIKKIKGE